MNEDERQVSPTIDGIRKDHVERYKFVADRENGSNILDCACGVGYGSWLLAGRADHVDGLEIDGEAILYAREHYSSNRVDYYQHDLNGIFQTVRPYQAAVAFECIEHLEHPEYFLKWVNADRLYASVPNESVFPYKDYAYHYKHYTAEEFEQLLNECGWQVDEWHGQTDHESEVMPKTQGRTLIAVCSRGEKRETWKTLPDPPKQGPQSVAIVAMGQSASSYIFLANQKGSRHKIADEIWAINNMGSVILHDRLFAMDDLMVQEMRAKADPGGSISGLVKMLKTHKGFYTSKSYAGYPGSIEYPLEAVCNTVGQNYFNSTVAYAVGLAIYEQIPQISFWGVDFTYPDRHIAEKGRGCIEFLIGVAITRGVTVAISGDSHLLDSAASPEERLYGYDAEHVEFEYKDGRTIVTKRPRDRLPTVEEIEKRYDKRGTT